MLKWIFTALTVFTCETGRRNDIQAIFSFAESGTEPLNVNVRLGMYLFRKEVSRLQLNDCGVIMARSSFSLAVLYTNYWLEKKKTLKHVTNGKSCKVVSYG